MTQARRRAEDFRAVGLSESDAASAARGLLEGVYVSYEDACLPKSIFSADAGTRLDQELMRDTAQRLAGGKPVES